MELESVNENDNKNSKKIKKIIQKKIDAEGLSNPKDEYTLLQPEKISLLWNNYVHVLKQLKSNIKINNE